MRQTNLDLKVQLAGMIYLGNQRHDFFFFQLTVANSQTCTHFPLFVLVKNIDLFDFYFPFSLYLAYTLIGYSVIFQHLGTAHIS